MRKHTPGPWRAHVGNGAGDHWNIHRKTPTIDGGYFCRVDAMNRNEEARATARANAKLIAAAPDLLKALVDLLRETSNGTQLCATEFALAAHDAIDKAQDKVAVDAAQG